jgi:hypothetical protein
VSTGRFNVYSRHSTGQFFDMGCSSEATDSDEGDQGNDEPNQDRESPDRSACVKVLDALFQIHLKMRNKTDEESDHGDDVLNDEEFVRSVHQRKITF